MLGLNGLQIRYGIPLPISRAPSVTRRVSQLQSVAGSLVENLSQVSMREVVITALLLGLVLLSAIGVVYSSHLGRQLIAEHSELQETRDQLQSEWVQLMLEESAWSSPNRIEQVANERLEMVMPGPEQVRLIY